MAKSTNSNDSNPNIRMEMIKNTVDISDELTRTNLVNKTPVFPIEDLAEDSLAAIDPEIADINFHYGKERAGDIPHSLASIAKAKHLLNYFPYFSIKDGLEVTVKSYTEDYSKVAVAAY